jgi:hypothetical protein
VRRIEIFFNGIRKGKKKGILWWLFVVVVVDAAAAAAVVGVIDFLAVGIW